MIRKRRMSIALIVCYARICDPVKSAYFARVNRVYNSIIAFCLFEQLEIVVGFGDCGYMRHNSKEPECTFIFHSILIGDSAKAFFCAHTHQIFMLLPLGPAVTYTKKSERKNQIAYNKPTLEQWFILHAFVWMGVRCAVWVCMALTFWYLGFCVFRNSSPSQKNRSIKTNEIHYIVCLLLIVRAMRT